MGPPRPLVVTIGVHVGELQAAPSLAAARLDIRSRRMLAQSALVFTASMALNLGGFIFHAIASRRLGVADYGALGAVVSACLIASLPAVIFTTVIARLAAEFRALEDDSHVRGLATGVAQTFGLAGIAYGIAGVAFAPLLSGFLHVPGWTIVLAGFIVAARSLASAFRAVVQGTQDFMGFSISNLLEGLGKPVVLIALVFVGTQLFAGVAAFLVGTVSGLAYIVWCLIARYRAVPARSVRYDWRRLAMASGGAAALTTAATLMGSADVVIVKHFFDAHQAGVYAAASLVGKILLYLVGFIPTVLVPLATDRHVRGEGTGHTLFLSLAMLVVLSVAGLAGFAFFGTPLLHALVGGAYDAASGLLVWYGLAMALMGLTTLLASYAIAVHRLAFTVPLLACACATLGAMSFVHPTLLAVVEILVVGNIVTAAVVAAAVGAQSLRPRMVEA